MANSLDGPRAARPEELADILVLANVVMREGRAPTIATDYPFIYNAENVGNIIIIRDGDRVISSAGTWMNTVEAGDGRIRAGGINCVATLPGCRGQGLATMVMRKAVQHIAALGCHIGRLTTNIDDWYYRMGWENAGSLYTYRLNHSNVELLPELPDELTVVETREFSDELFEAIVGLRQADRLGGVRTPELMRALLEAGSDPKLMGGKRFVVASQGSVPLAYCLDTERGIIEWGGDGRLVAGLIREWFGRRVGQRGGKLSPGYEEKVAPSRELAVITPRTGHTFIELLETVSLSVDHAYWGMLNVIDPRGILDAFGLESIDLREENGMFTLSRGHESITVTRQALAKLLFGPERIAGFAADRLPFLFWEWPLEHV